MACDLLKKGWTTDEVNSRLGHRPSSRELDKYVNFLALDRHKPKKKLFDNQLQSVLQELEEMKAREKLKSTRDIDILNTIDSLKLEIDELKKEVRS